jgi:exopolyphosphatase/guanosine-5'-triphosphate,3'-diphosphate pyrophosphatase
MCQICYRRVSKHSVRLLEAAQRVSGIDYNQRMNSPGLDVSAPANSGTVAAVDLGSNSFRLQVGRVVGNQIYPMDGLKESVRLAAGLTAEKTLDAVSQQRGLEALARFGQRLRGFPSVAVRAVATNTLRVAKNAQDFLDQAEDVLGFPIEVIAGREEARLIYLGVAHTVPNPAVQQLVVDIGGGSTECIIGRNIEPIVLESMYMGCVSYSLKYFPDGKVDKRAFKEAELAARRELQSIAATYLNVGWSEAIGSSGTAKAIVDLVEANKFSPQGISREGLRKLRDALIEAGDVDKLRLQGLRADRLPVLPGGLAIMSAIFKEFGLEQMNFSEGALRLGVLYDLLGRYHHDDLREATVNRFMQRYEVDRRHAARVVRTALDLLHQLVPDTRDDAHADARALIWAGRLHEIGVSIAHSSYHKHSAYILANADMPGFSRPDQTKLARLVLAHRGKLERARPLDGAAPEWTLIFCLRLAALLHRSREPKAPPLVAAGFTQRGFRISINAQALKQAPLTAAALAEEPAQWESVGGELRIETVE